LSTTSTPSTIRLAAPTAAPQSAGGTHLGARSGSPGAQYRSGQQGFNRSGYGYQFANPALQQYYNRVTQERQDQFYQDELDRYTLDARVANEPAAPQKQSERFPKAAKKEVPKGKSAKRAMRVHQLRAFYSRLTSLEVSSVKYRGEKDYLMDRITLIQACWRGWLVRKRLLLRYILNRAATKLQSLYRGYAARKVLKGVIGQLRKQVRKRQETAEKEPHLISELSTKISKLESMNSEMKQKLDQQSEMIINIFASREASEMNKSARLLHDLKDDITFIRNNQSMMNNMSMDMRRTTGLDTTEVARHSMMKSTLLNDTQRISKEANLSLAESSKGGAKGPGHLEGRDELGDLSNKASFEDTKGRESVSSSNEKRVPVDMVSVNLEEFMNRKEKNQNQMGYLNPEIRRLNMPKKKNEDSPNKEIELRNEHRRNESQKGEYGLDVVENADKHEFTSRDSRGFQSNRDLELQEATSEVYDNKEEEDEECPDIVVQEAQDGSEEGEGLEGEEEQNSNSKSAQEENGEEEENAEDEEQEEEEEQENEENEGSEGEEEETRAEHESGEEELEEYKPEPISAKFKSGAQKLAPNQGIGAGTKGPSTSDSSHSSKGGCQKKGVYSEQ
jgi:hypothetical protein